MIAIYLIALQSTDTYSQIVKYKFKNFRFAWELDTVKSMQLLKMASQADIFGPSPDTYNSSEMSSQSSTPTLPSSSSCSATTKDWDTVSDSVRSQWILSTRTGLAPGWFWSHGYDVQARVADNHHGSPIWLCCHCVRRKANKPKAYVSSNTRNIEGHLAKAHNIFHPDPSKAKRYASERTSNSAPNSAHH